MNLLIDTFDLWFNRILFKSRLKIINKWKRQIVDLDTQIFIKRTAYIALVNSTTVWCTEINDKAETLKSKRDYNE